MNCIAVQSSKQCWGYYSIIPTYHTLPHLKNVVPTLDKITYFIVLMTVLLKSHVIHGKCHFMFAGVHTYQWAQRSMAGNPETMEKYLDTQETVAALAGHCNRSGYPVGRMSSVVVDVSLAVAAGVLPPRVPQEQQAMEERVGHRQQLPSPHESSPLQQDQAPPVGLQQGAQVAAQQQGLELKLISEVSLLVPDLMTGAQKAEVVHNNSYIHHHCPHHQSPGQLVQICQAFSVCVLQDCL